MEKQRQTYKWIPTHGHARFDQPARTNLHQLSADTECSLEEPARSDGWMHGWMGRETKRVREIRCQCNLMVMLYMCIIFVNILSKMWITIEILRSFSIHLLIECCFYIYILYTHVCVCVCVCILLDVCKNFQLIYMIQVPMVLWL